jgi:hypothetical protein
MESPREFAKSASLERAEDERWLADAIALRDAEHAAVLAQSRAECDRLTTQLAGVSVAALGGTSPTAVAMRDQWGWSVAYQDTLDLRRKYDALRAQSEIDLQQHADLCGQIEALRAQLDRAVGYLGEARRHLESATEIILAEGGDEDDGEEEKYFIADIDKFIASLAVPSQPEPVKGHAFVSISTNPLTCRTCFEYFDSPNQDYVPTVPENAGTPCVACEELGGFTEMGTPTRFFTTDRVCGICDGSGMVK